MKAKTIRKVLKAKVEDWASSVEDEAIAKIIRKNVIITGGSIASMLLKESVNDYDVYFLTKEAAYKVTRYYVKQYIASKPDLNIKPTVQALEDRVRIMVKSAGIVDEDTDDSTYKYFEMLPEGNTEHSEYVNEDQMREMIQEIPPENKEGLNKYRPVFMSSNAITLSGKIQMVIRFFGTPDEIHENYDFTHCTCWWSSWDNHLELRADAMEALLARELRYQGSKYPLCSIIRTRKFIKRGYTINAGQYLKMCMQLNELDLTDVSVLEDQLTGVDVAYFFQVIEYIKNNDKDITSTYISAIIDRIF